MSSPLYFRGKRIEDLTRDELIEAVRILAAGQRDLIENRLKFARMQQLLDERPSAKEMAGK